MRAGIRRYITASFSPMRCGAEFAFAALAVSQNLDFRIFPPEAAGGKITPVRNDNLVYSFR
jgi:hypothetical protein